MHAQPDTGDPDGQDQKSQASRHDGTERARQMLPGQQDQVTEAGHKQNDVARWKAGAVQIDVGRK